MRILLVILLTSWFVLINCYATDSTGVAQLAKTTSNLVAASPTSVAEPQDCIESPVTGQATNGGFVMTDTSTCPPDHPIAYGLSSHSGGIGGVGIVVTSVVTKCCKTKIEYIDSTGNQIKQTNPSLIAQQTNPSLIKHS